MTGRSKHRPSFLTVLVSYHTSGPGRSDPRLYYIPVAVTFLSSKRNGMLTVYDVSRHDDGLIRVNDSPYSVMPNASYCRFTGLAFLKHESRALSVFRAGERASVDCIQLNIPSSEEVENIVSVSVEESEAVKQLADDVGNMKTSTDIFGDQEKVVTDLFPAYDRKHGKRFDILPF